MKSSSWVSSRAMPYWKPVQPPATTNTRSARSLDSCSRRARARWAAFSVTLMRDCSVIMCRSRHLEAGSLVKKYRIPQTRCQRRRLLRDGNGSAERYSVEGRDDRRVVARAHLLQHHARPRWFGERLAGQDVVDPPADVALPHLTPGRPPGEETVVLRLETTA